MKKITKMLRGGGNPPIHDAATVYVGSRNLF